MSWYVPGRLCTLLNATSSNCGGRPNAYMSSWKRHAREGGGLFDRISIPCVIFEISPWG